MYRKIILFFQKNIGQPNVANQQVLLFDIVSNIQEAI